MKQKKERQNNENKGRQSKKKLCIINDFIKEID